MALEDVPQDLNILQAFFFFFEAADVHLKDKIGLDTCSWGAYSSPVSPLIIREVYTQCTCRYFSVSV